MSSLGLEQEVTRSDSTLEQSQDGRWEAPGKVSGSSKGSWRSMLKLGPGGYREWPWQSVRCSHLSPTVTKVQEGYVKMSTILRAPAPVCPDPTEALQTLLTKHAPAYAPGENPPFPALLSGQVAPCLQSSESPAEVLPMRSCLVDPKCKANAPLN